MSHFLPNQTIARFENLDILRIIGWQTCILANGFVWVTCLFVANIVAKTAIVSSALEVTRPEYESFD